MAEIDGDDAHEFGEPFGQFNSNKTGLTRLSDTVWSRLATSKLSVLPRVTGRHAMAAMMIEHRQRWRKCGLWYSMWLECTPKTVGPVTDRHEAFVYVLRDVLHSRYN